MNTNKAIGILQAVKAGTADVFISKTAINDALDLAISALEKQSRIITVTDAEGGLLASISDKDIIEENGVHVIISEE